MLKIVTNYELKLTNSPPIPLWEIKECMTNEAEWRIKRVANYPENTVHERCMCALKSGVIKTEKSSS